MTALASDAAALLRHVLERPEDDAPALILADWYDEHDRPELAELIRLETRLDRRGRKNTGGFKEVGAISRADWNRHWHLKQQERAVYDEIRAAVGMVPVVGDLEYDTQTWGSNRVVYATRRGLVTELGGYTEPFMEYAAALFARFPIQRVGLSDRSPEESVFDNQPSSCRWIWVWNDRSPDTPSSLPDALFHQLKIASFRDGGNDWAGYPTWDAAREALSDACVRYGRMVAGLP